MRDFEILNPKSKSLITNEDNLSEFCSRNNMPYAMIDISELDNFKKPFGFIHTGETKNQYNGGNVNHWMFLAGDKVFDSYGLQEEFLLPEWCKYVVLHPKRIQEYGSNVCGEYCCTFYKFAHSQTDQNDEDIGLDYCHSLGLTENRGHNDRIVQAAFAQEGGELDKQAGVEGGARKKFVPSFDKYKDYDISRFLGHHMNKDQIAFVEDLMGPDAGSKISKIDIETLHKLFASPKTFSQNKDVYAALGSRYPEYHKSVSGLAERLQNKAYAKQLQDYYDSGPFTSKQVAFWKAHVALNNPKKKWYVPSPGEPDTSTAPDKIPVKNPADELHPATPRPDNVTPAVVPVVPSGTAEESNNSSTKPEPGVDSGQPIPDSTSAQKELTPENTTPNINPLLPQEPGWTPAGPGAQPPFPKLPPGDPEKEKTWFQSIREKLGLKTDKANMPNEIINPPFAELPSNFDMKNAKVPEPLNFPVPSFTPMPDVVREATIQMAPVENYTPNMTTVPTSTTIPTGAHNAVKRMRLDGTLETVPKKARGAVTAFNTIQSYVPMPQDVDEITTVPFQYPQFQQLTAVPQLATMDRGFFKAGTNKLNTPSS